jgi:hypothetical protein
MTDTLPEQPVTPAPPASPEYRDEPAHASGRPALAIGAILVVVGLLLFLGQVLDIGLGDAAWPFWVIAAGVAILLVGLAVAHERGMVIAGSVVTTVGLVLLYQNATGHWESWAYAWALVGPAASGLGLAIWGVRSGSATDVRAGTWGLLGGLAILAIGFLFFEGVLGLSGERLPIADWALPALVIVIGAVMLARGLLRRGEPEPR